MPSFPGYSPVTKAVPKAPTKVAKKIPTKHRAPWTDADDVELLLGFKEGLSPARLASRCHRTKAAVAGRLHHLGILVFDKDRLAYSTAPKLWLKVK